MNSKQKRTLIAIYTDPVSASLVWKDIESLFVCIGAEVIEGNGSRVRFHKNGVIASFHRPHPKKEAKPYQVKDARSFLIQLGVVP
ncbi:type II toxin-antitoxin system HicA family toxin [Shewanella inventionis]|uniref:type II toxin-antitoxin system HicA family toxin n=1 Tax=Shewanella inventionis TaxID=1738770 RepID=UPI00166DE871|nr:type II toxin-antitoxin system HicA family toxin [Shewanella inventionis]